MPADRALGPKVLTNAPPEWHWAILGPRAWEAAVAADREWGLCGSEAPPPKDAARRIPAPTDFLNSVCVASPWA